MSEDLEVKVTQCLNGGPGCSCSCGMLAYVDRKTGRVIKVEGDPSNPISRGFLCEHIKDHAVEWLYHPDRLNYPLKRIGERGEGKWQRISWEQALDEIAARLKGLIQKYGPETVAVSEGTYRTDLYWVRARFLGGLGNPMNVIDPGTICSTNCVMIQHTMVGTNTHTPDIMNAKLILVVSRNLSEAFPIHWHIVRERKKRGEVKLITLDPRLTETARNSDYWLQLRPGTDGALLGSWINVIISEGLYDKEFVEKWTNAPFLVQEKGPKMLRECDIAEGGSEEKFVVWDTNGNGLAVYNPEDYTFTPADTNPALTGAHKVRLVTGEEVSCKTAWQMLTERVSKFTPEWSERVTWVPKEQIVETARMYATTKPACMYRGVAPDQIGRNASQIELCKSILRTITGNLDVPGGDVMTFPGPIMNGGRFRRDAMLQMEELCKPETRRKQLGSDRFRLMTWPAYEIQSQYYKKRYGISMNMSNHGFLIPVPLVWRTILSGQPYPITALFTWTSNPLVWAANTKLVYKALKSPNIQLHVVMELWMTPTAELADYVLPVASKSFERAYCSTHEDFHSAVRVWEQVVKPTGERKNEYEIFRELAIRLGFGELFPWETYEEVVEHRLEPLGLTLREAAKRRVLYTPIFKNYEQIDPKAGKPYGFGTASRRVEIYNYVFERLGFDPLPQYEEPVESPVTKPMLAKKYPLILNTGGRFRPMFHSENRQLGMGLREMHPYPMADIHPDTALEYGISDGDWIWIETTRGRIKQRARVTSQIHPNVVNVEASWWYPEQPGEEPWLHGVWISNANVLCLDEPDTLDPLTGGWTCRAMLCRVYKAQGIDAL